uniref:Uncharacterized protein AlNc14C151G7540 n=1 Tax=Albugo laibachii Nc14 TaxID=890382 RepID=F0WM29_9STRA|nr:conserved hypothetical protein [Albugo laibachii Nc14]|eukprot:CCA22356.1 conserved hypothetical protein [Albugo laibachii Nc14]
MSSRPQFPLPANYFPKCVISSEKAQAYKLQMDDLLKTGLQEENQFVTSESERMARKLCKRKSIFRLFRPSIWSIKNGPLLPEDLKPSKGNSSCRMRFSRKRKVMQVVCVSHIQGKLEDLMYGMQHSTSEEYRAFGHLTHDKTLDGTILASIESGTFEDPFGFLGIKWSVRAPFGKKLSKRQDVCCIESSGLSKDQHGAIFGYRCMEAIHEPSLCPLFPAKYVTRAQVFKSICIARQITPTTIQMYTAMTITCENSLWRKALQYRIAKSLLSMDARVDCGLAKKLLSLAWKRQEEEQKCHYLSKIRRCSFPSVQRRRSSTKWPFVRSFCCNCIVGRRARRMCQLCQSRVCKQCALHCPIFAEGRMTWSVCKNCVAEAHNIPVDPEIGVKLRDKLGKDLAFDTSGCGSSFAASSATSSSSVGWMLMSNPQHSPMHLTSLGERYFPTYKLGKRSPNPTQVSQRSCANPSLADTRTSSHDHGTALEVALMESPSWSDPLLQSSRSRKLSSDEASYIQNECWDTVPPSESVFSNVFFEHQLVRD